MDDGACARTTAIIQTAIHQSREWRLRARMRHMILSQWELKCRNIDGEKEYKMESSNLMNIARHGLMNPLIFEVYPTW
jgi:hypothetical protein